MLFRSTEESFSLSFETNPVIKGPLEVEKWNEDMVVGLRGPISDENMDLLMETLRLTMENWRPASLVRPVALAEL